MKGKVVYGRLGPAKWFLGDREVTRDEYEAAFPPKKILGCLPPAGPALTGWPIVSDALAVHPLDVDKARESARHHGVPTDFTPQGQPILRDRQHRRLYMQKVRKVFDRNSFTGY